METVNNAPEQGNATTVKSKNKKAIIITVAVLGLILVIGVALFSYKTYFEPQKHYESAVELYNEKDYSKALEEFELIKDFKDSSKYIDECKKVIEDENNYNKAIELFNAEKYPEAIELFEKNSEYKDSKDYIEKSKKLNDLLKKYNKAVDYENKSEYFEAIALFKKIGDYKDSKERIKICTSEKDNWGKLKQKNIISCVVNDEGEEYLIATLYEFEQIKNLTGYEAFVTFDMENQELSGKTVTIESASSIVCDNCNPDGSPYYIKIRAYKKCIGGQIIYGEWTKIDNKQKTETKSVKESEFVKNSESYALLEECFDNVDWDGYYAKENQKKGIGDDNSITSYNDINGLVFTCTEEAISDDGSVHGIGKKFNSGILDLGVLYKITDKTIKQYEFFIERTKDTSETNFHYTSIHTTYIYTASKEDKYAKMYVNFPVDGYYQVIVYDHSTGKEIASGKAYVGEYYWPENFDYSDLDG